jgi:type IV pilus assembly protein PilX
MGKKSNLILRNESGMALAVALFMIVILSLLGLASSSTSTFEVSLSGNKRGAADAFYTAEAGSQSVIANVANFSTASYTPVTDQSTLVVELRNESIDSKYPPDPQNPPSTMFSYPGGVSYQEAPAVTIYHTTTAGPPRGLGFSAIHFEFQNYIIDSIGRDQLDVGTNKSTCQVREKIVRLVPTTHGGY